MSALENILLVANLLSSRSAVTIEAICSLCHVSDRTARQYIEFLTKANVPVYYDDRDKGFRLVRKDGVRVDHLRIDEVIVMILALKKLSRIVNDAYRTAIDDLIQKILSGQSFSVDALQAILSGTGGTVLSSKDLSVLLTSHIINVAIATERKLHLTLKKSGQEEKTIAIIRPRLQFNRGWHIVENSPEDNERIDLKDILSAAII